jgi:hypothetical protein
VNVPGLLAAAAVLALFGCTDNARPAHASTIDPTCADPAAWRTELEAVPAGAIAKVEPKLFWHTCPGTAQVVGTKLLLRTDALGPERRTQMLACRSAHVYLGEDEAVSGRPAWLPGGWMDVDAEPAGDDLALTLSADTVPKNIRLFSDMRALARR